MKPVPLTQLETVLTPMLTSQILEANITARVSPDHILKGIAERYPTQAAAVFVDDLEDPKAGLFLGLQKSWMLDELICQVFRIWIHPDRRDQRSVGLIAEMFKTVEAYAELHDCDSIMGSSWRYEAATDSGVIWRKNGFNLQENIFVKLIK